MRRAPLGLLVGVLLGVAVAVPTALIAAPPKTVTVVTPMKQDLDANGYSILNANAITATGNITAQSNIQTSGYFVGDKLVAMSGEMILEPPDTSVISISSGAFDPSVTGLDKNTGSVYFRGAPTPQAWLHTGTDPHAWTCFAGCAT